MKNRPGTLTFKLDSREGAAIRRALAAEQRVKLLNLLAKRAMNVNEIATSLNISQPTASVHIRVLEEAGLVGSEYVPTDRGSEKRCWATFQKLVFEAEMEPEARDELTDETQMPIGLFTSISVEQPCGLASENNIIGFNDNPQSFLLAERAQAQILWFSSGWIEYTFPGNLPPNADVLSVEFVAELCSETPLYNNEWPSDITIWINGIEVGTWMSPGDFGGTRGRLNPDWWPANSTQYGMLKTWSVDENGSRVDGNPVSGVRLSDLKLSYQRPIVVRIGNKHNAAHIGGVNLFGRHFGNYPQDLVLRTRYRLKALSEMPTSVEGDL